MTYTKNEITTDVLVIGGGIAAIFAAKRAANNGASVTLVDKGSVGRSGQSPFATGMAVFDEAEDADRDTWHANMAEAAENLNNPAYLDVLIDYSKELYEELEEWGATEEGFGGVIRSKMMELDIDIIERTMITTLLEENGTIAGAVGFKLDNEEALVIKAKSVILCTGAGGFKPSGFQVCSLTFDGDAMAYRIGAKISGKEFVDTHVANNETPAYCWGQWGGMWTRGNPSMTGGPDPEGMDALDLAKYHEAHAGSIGGQSGMGNNPIGGASAGLSVHKSEGLFPSDNKCGTSITGLYAAGDCLSSMLVGPIYKGVGGFAFSGSATQGALAGETAAEYIKSTELISMADSKIDTAITEMYQPLNNEQGYSPAWVEHMIQGTLIPYYVLFIKHEDRLNAALTNVEFYREHFAGKLKADDLHGLRKAHEVKNMLLNAEMKLRSSLFRTESRGNHYREDFPDRNDNDWLAWVVIQKGNDGSMELEKFLIEDFEKLVV